MGGNSNSPLKPRDRTVRLVLDGLGSHDSECAAIRSVAAKVGCATETLRKPLRQAKRDRGTRPGLTTGDHYAGA